MLTIIHTFVWFKTSAINVNLRFTLHSLKHLLCVLPFCFFGCLAFHWYKRHGQYLYLPRNLFHTILFLINIIRYLIITIVNRRIITYVVLNFKIICADVCYYLNFSNGNIFHLWMILIKVKVIYCIFRLRILLTSNKS